MKNQKKKIVLLLPCFIKFQLNHRSDSAVLILGFGSKHSKNNIALNNIIYFVDLYII